MVLGEDYTFCDNMKEDTIPIKLLSGPYKDVVYRYIKVAIREKKKDETAVLNFDYHLHEMGEHTEIKLRRDPKFNQHIGLVLNALILESLSAPQFEAKAPNNEHRESRPKESTQE